MAREFTEVDRSMSLMQKITALCIDHPQGIDVEQLIKLCPEATRKQVSAAVRNAYTRGLR